MNIGNKLKEKFLHKKTSCDPYWENERKITSDNIVELSQFKVGDTVTLIKPIVNDVDIFEVGRTMRVKKIINDSYNKLPDMSFEEFKSKFKVDEDIFTLFLIDDKTGASAKCNAYHVIKGTATKSEIKTIINYRIKQADKRLTILFASILVIILIAFLAHALQDTIYGYLLVIACIPLSCVLGRLSFGKIKPFTKIKNKQNGRPLAIPCKGESIKCNMSAEELQLLYGKENVKTIEPKEEYKKLFKEDK